MYICVLFHNMSSHNLNWVQKESINLSRLFKQLKKEILIKPIRMNLELAWSSLVNQLVNSFKIIILISILLNQLNDFDRDNLHWESCTSNDVSIGFYSSSNRPERWRNWGWSRSTMEKIVLQIFSTERSLKVSFFGSWILAFLICKWFTLLLSYLILEMSDIIHLIN